MLRAFPFILVIVLMPVFTARAEPAPSDVHLGAQLFGRTCAACHSLLPNRNMTGPSLAGIWRRKAGRLGSFERYSSALKAANIVWDSRTLDAWLKSPAQFIPNNYMTFAGISNAQERTDLIAFLKEASAGELPASMLTQRAGMAPRFQDLKKAGLNRRVVSIRNCRDSYFVTTADGKTVPFWEPNLRFETDSSEFGPPDGTPVIMPAGMMGDRAAVIFARPDEISPFIKHHC